MTEGVGEAVEGRLRPPLRVGVQRPSQDPPRAVHVRRQDPPGGAPEAASAKARVEPRVRPLGARLALEHAGPRRRLDQAVASATSPPAVEAHPEREPRPRARVGHAVLQRVEGALHEELLPEQVGPHSIDVAAHLQV